MALAQHPAFDHFTDTVAQLCDPETGCPWNRTQTHESLGQYLIEEAYETLDAIQAGDVRHLREELGDVLLQVVLQSQIAANAGEFTIDDVTRGIDEKMIRRHPHVFGDVKAENENEVALLWEQVKLAEKLAEKQAEKQTGEPAGEQALPDGAARQSVASGAQESLLDDVPIHFPALLQAQKISRRAAAAGFEWDTLADVWNKVDEERAELMEAYDAAPKSADGMVLTSQRESDAVQMEFGDLLFALVNVARRMGIDAEAALIASNAKFRRRFAAIESEARAQSKAVQDLSLDEMEAVWQRTKEGEHADACVEEHANAGAREQEGGHHA